MLSRLMRTHHGVVRTRVLIDTGISTHQIRQAVATGQLIRICHGWVATPDADPQLVFAARHRLTLSCTTQALRLNLWVSNATAQHFAVPRHGTAIRPPDATLHFGLPLVPREPFMLEDCIENVLVYIASCQPYEDAVATWDSALKQQLVERQNLEQLPLRARARKILADTTPFADSGLESLFRLRLKWLNIRLVPQAWVLGHRVDFLLGDKLVIQIDGGHHVGQQRTSDIQHDAKLRLHGYSVIRFGYQQVMHDWPAVQAVIMQAVAQGLHLS